MRIFLVGAVLAAGLSACKKEPTGKAEVECRGGPRRSWCTIKHVEGDSKLDVYWKRRFSCEGRHPAIVNGSASGLEPGETKSAQFGAASDADGCNVTGSEIYDLEVTPAR